MQNCGDQSYQHYSHVKYAQKKFLHLDRLTIGEIGSLFARLFFVNLEIALTSSSYNTDHCKKMFRWATFFACNKLHFSGFHIYQMQNMR